MLKIFTTQLAGIFSRIQDKESEAIEDGARLLAQADRQRSYHLFIRRK